jgi:hypothetical protein
MSLIEERNKSRKFGGSQTVNRESEMVFVVTVQNAGGEQSW